MSARRPEIPGMTISHRQRVAVLAAYGFSEAMRSRLLWLLLVILLLGIGLVQFLGALAITDTRAIQAGLLGSLLRLCAVFVVALFVVTSMVREMNDKLTELFLATDVPRAVYLFGRLAGYALFALLAAALFCLPLLFLAPIGQVVIWGLSLLGELLLVAAASMLCALSFRQVTVGLTAVAGFYLLSRSMGAIQLLAQGGVLDAGDPLARAASVMVNAIAYLVPDLYRFTSSDWLVYPDGGWAVLAPVLLQTVVYGSLLCAAALFDLYRKAF